MTAPITLDGESLTPHELEAVARDRAEVSLDADARAKVTQARKRIERVLDSPEAVYGVTTGFGRLVDQRIDREDLHQLQTNLVRSHAAGTGEPLPSPIVRAVLVTRANALAKGFSGVRPVVIDRLLEFLNADIIPILPRRGSLGASGDLAPLAHLALVLIGEGEAIVDGDRVDGATANAAIGVDPLELKAKEGLALINGTQISLAIATLLVVDATRVLDAADAAAALTTEVTKSTETNCDPSLASVRGHPGQAATAANIRRLTEGSEVLAEHGDCDRVQDAYAIRCIPQIHGATRTAIEHLRTVVETELNAATDNPLVFAGDAVDDRAPGSGDAAVLSGGNFHGEPLALPLEYAQGALANLATVTERRVDRILNPAIQEDYLPPFLASDPGLESGMMIAQYTAASVGNAARSQARPSQDNVSVSGQQEDYVAMSAESALSGWQTLEWARVAVAIELLCGVFAAGYLPAELRHGRGTDAVIDRLHQAVTPLAQDRSLSDDIETVSELIAEGAIESALMARLDQPLERHRDPPSPERFR